MVETVADLGVSGWIETKTVFVTASYYLAITLILLVLVQILSSKRRVFKLNKRTKNAKEKAEHVAGLEALPGPKPIPIAGNAFDFWPLNNTIYIALKWSRTYGQVFKFYAPINMPVVILNSGPHIQSLLKSSDFGHLTKMPLVYDLLKPYMINGLLVSKGKLWQRERKILLRSQTFQALMAYIPRLNNHCERFVDSLDKLFADGGVHTINSAISTTFLEVICEMVTGFDMHDTVEGAEYHHHVQTWKATVSHRLIYLWNIPDFIFRLNPLSKKYDVATKHLLDFARRRLREHEERRREAAQVLMDSADESSKNSTPPVRSVLDDLVDAGLPEDQIIDEVNTMLFGGHETSATVIHLFCFAMGLYPEIQETCRKEIDEVFEDPMQVQNGRMTYDSLANLKYVERTILETMRLYPSVFIYFRQLQTPLKIEYKNEPVELPVGTNVGVFPFGLHRQEEIYPDPERFDPDRFLPEEMAKRHAYAYAPFSHGPRNCIGFKFAMIEMKMVVAYLLRNFSIGTTDKVDDVKLLPNLTLTPERDYNFIFKRRVITR